MGLHSRRGRDSLVNKEFQEKSSKQYKLKFTKVGLGVPCEIEIILVKEIHSHIKRNGRLPIFILTRSFKNFTDKQRKLLTYFTKIQRLYKYWLPPQHIVITKISEKRRGVQVLICTTCMSTVRIFSTQNSSVYLVYIVSVSSLRPGRFIRVVVSHFVSSRH